MGQRWPIAINLSSSIPRRNVWNC